MLFGISGDSLAIASRLPPLSERSTLATSVRSSHSGLPKGHQALKKGHRFFAEVDEDSPAFKRALLRRNFSKWKQALPRTAESINTNQYWYRLHFPLHLENWRCRAAQAVRLKPKQVSGMKW